MVSYFDAHNASDNSMELCFVEKHSIRVRKAEYLTCMSSVHTFYTTNWQGLWSLVDPLYTPIRFTRTHSKVSLQILLCALRCMQAALVVLFLPFHWISFCCLWFPLLCQWKSTEPKASSNGSFLHRLVSSQLGNHVGSGDVSVRHWIHHCFWATQEGPASSEYGWSKIGVQVFFKIPRQSLNVLILT